DEVVSQRAQGLGRGEAAGHCQPRPYKYTRRTRDHVKSLRIAQAQRGPGVCGAPAPSLNSSSRYPSAYDDARRTPFSGRNWSFWRILDKCVSNVRDVAGISRFQTLSASTSRESRRSEERRVGEEGRAACT